MMIKQQVFRELFENFTPFSPEVLIYLFYMLLSSTLQYLTSLVIFTESPGIRLQNCLVPACVRSDISSLMLASVEETVMITFFRNRIPQPTQRPEYTLAKLRFCRTIRVKTFFRLIFFVLTAVFVIWLSSVTKTTWMGIEKHHGLAQNTCFGHHVHVKNSCKSPKLSLKISTGVTGALFQHLLR